jgi:hypothetical protein
MHTGHEQCVDSPALDLSLRGKLGARYAMHLTVREQKTGRALELPRRCRSVLPIHGNSYAVAGVLQHGANEGADCVLILAQED